MNRMFGWRRLWVAVSVLYLVPVAVVAVLRFPGDEVQPPHSDAFYKQMKAESIGKLALSSWRDGTPGWYIDPDDVDMTVHMPNDHLLPFRKGVTRGEMRTVGAEYLAIVARTKTQERARVVAYALLAWIGPCIALFLLGWGIGRMRRGFVKPDAT